MSRKLSAFIALTLVSMIVSLVRAVQFGSLYDVPEFIGFTIGIALFGVVVSVVVGFISGAVRQGSFKKAFFIGYMTVVAGLTFVLTLSIIFLR